jgi:hypothetical protein
MCGPSFTPIHRAKYLSKKYNVIIKFPYLINKEEQIVLFDKFYTKTEYRDYIFNFFNIENTSIKIDFYDAFYIKSIHIILAYNNIFDNLYNTNGIIIFEEPAHIFWSPFAIHSYINNIIILNKYRKIGILHTNYSNMIKNYNVPFINKYIDEIIKNTIINFNNLIYSNIDKIIPISQSLYPDNLINNNIIIDKIHCCDDKFFKLKQIKNLSGFYYCGQLIIDFKNLDILCKYIKKCDIIINIHGTGNDEKELKKSFGNNGIFHGKSYDIINDCKKYKCYISTSINEGLCTATMEAIVMNKFVIIPKHKSNKMFYKYKNVMTFTNFKEFSNSIDFVKNNQPIFFDAKIYKDFKWENCNKQLEKYF